MQTFKRLASCRSCAGLIGLGQVENLEDGAQCICLQYTGFRCGFRVHTFAVS